MKMVSVGMLSFMSTVCLFLSCSFGSETKPKPQEVDIETIVEPSETIDSDEEPSSPPSPSLPVKKSDAPLNIRFHWPELSLKLQHAFTETKILRPFHTALLPYLYGNVLLKVEMHPIPGSIRVEQGLVLEAPLFSELVNRGEDWIQAQNLSPIFSALAAYRNKVANNNDMRVFSFRLFIESGNCRFYSEADDPTVLKHQTSSCMKSNGKQICGSFDSKGLRFSKEQFKQIKSCF